jgi:Zn-dependent peptidase ImmA (M78 family)
MVKKHKTNDPFCIAEQKNIMILFNYLGETLGFFSTYKRAKFIHINNMLNRPLKRFVCAHELGHAILHPGINTPFLKANTLFSINRLEREANEFAVELLMPDDLIKEYNTIQEAAAACEVPFEITQLKRFF